MIIENLIDFNISIRNKDECTLVIKAGKDRVYQFDILLTPELEKKIEQQINQAAIIQEKLIEDAN